MDHILKCSIYNNYINRSKIGDMYIPSFERPKPFLDKLMKYNDLLLASVVVLIYVDHTILKAI